VRAESFVDYTFISIYVCVNNSWAADGNQRTEGEGDFQLGVQLRT
jgi:hypothetical protein